MTLPSIFATIGLAFVITALSTMSYLSNTGMLAP